jgi:hypothetical protein
MTSERALAQFQLDDGSTVLFEIPEPDTGSALAEVSRDMGERVYEAKQTLDQALSQVQPVANLVLSRLKTGLTTPADEVQVKFGLKLSANSSVIFSSVGGDLNFEVTLKWTKPQT